MFEVPFYHSTTRKYIISFGNLFNEISIQRFTSTGDVEKTIRVPIAYAPKEKYLQRINQESSIDTDGTRVKMTLPRMGFHLLGMRYDSERKLNTLQKQSLYNSDGSASYQYQPVPFNFELELYAMTKQYDDMLQIAEQILPYFGPQVNMNIIDNDEFPDEYKSIPLVLTSVDPKEDYEDQGQWATRRSIVWTFGFTLKGYLYGNTRSMPLIRQAITDTSTSCTMRPADRTMITVNPYNASPGDDFGFSIINETIEADD